MLNKMFKILTLLIIISCNKSENTITHSRTDLSTKIYLDEDDKVIQKKFFDPSGNLYYTEIYEDEKVVAVLGFSNKRNIINVIIPDKKNEKLILDLHTNSNKPKTIRYPDDAKNVFIYFFDENGELKKEVKR